MVESPTPRQIVKRMLQGIAPPRPLFLPIVFSLGARIENLPLRAFLSNPTKISNSLIRIRGHLRSDGVACYFDPCLEAEALGAGLSWQTEEQPPTLHWSTRARKGALPEGLRSPEQAAKSGRIGIAVEVIRRLKTLLRDDSLLMAGVAGPFTLAAQLTQLEREDTLHREDVPDAAIELAASMITQVSSAFVEAGANLIIIQEEVLPALSAEDCEAWAGLLAPTFNIIRFYEALPVLQFSNHHSLAENREVIFRRHWDCILCPVLDGISSRESRRMPELGASTIGVALPRESFQIEEAVSEEAHQSLCQAISELRPAILTTAGDVPASTDMKRLIRILENVSGAMQGGTSNRKLREP